jgi:predicted Zn-dependent peptidase
MITAQIGARSSPLPKPIAVVVSGNLQTAAAIASLERQFGRTPAGEIPAALPHPTPNSLQIKRDHIPKPLPQGALGYVVEGPPAGTREALAWRMLLYVLTHDYSGRLGRSAIGEKGIVYHIYSLVRTDGRRTWATISTGVDPGKADAMEAELKAGLANLISEPPTAAEVDAARNHLLGRDLTAAQSNDEITAKLAREFVETGAPRSHEQLKSQLQTITPADLAAAAQAFGKGTILRVDVDAPVR